jgi:ABC-type Zn uptake system ZnuABC Zn-binding protein ZnuA/ABC-type Mn2+/Zn2+ transport system permease subunit
MLEPFALPFVQEGLIQILLLSVATGLIGSWVVLRGLSFYSHAIGTASFPGLVLADGLGFPAAFGAFGMAGLFTGLTALVGRSRRTAADSATALVLVTCLAAGVILASDVFGSGANVDTLLFGSLLAIGPADLWLAGGAALLALAANATCSAHWLAKGFDEGSAANLRSGSVRFDLALLATIAVTVTAALSAVGALLIAALMVIPAATVRMFSRRVVTLQTATVLLVAAEGTLGLWLSVKTDAPPGATIAVVSGAVFTLALLARTTRRLRPAAVALAAGAALLVAGCGGGGGDDGRLKVVATTTQVADLVREVGGDEVSVAQILQPNTDPHEYEPRPSDVQDVADADLIFRSGGHLDEWAGDLVTDSGSEAEVVDLSLGLPVELGGEDHDHAGHAGEDHEHAGEDHEHAGHDHGEIDPHWWQDPVNARAATGKVEAALAEADPGAARAFRHNARAYEGRLTRLDRDITECLASVPASERKMVTDHDAFDYFAKRYGIEIVGAVVPALTTQAQPSAGDLAELERTIREEDVKAVFPESSASAKLAEALAADTGAGVGNELYGDTLGATGSTGATYIGMVEANANSIMLGLTGGRRGCDFE